MVLDWIAQRNVDAITSFIFGMDKDAPVAAHASEAWQEFVPFAMAHTPLKMSIDEAHNEVRIGWANSYSPEAIGSAVDALNHKPQGYRINILIARLCFRGIYFPQMGRFAWVKTILENRRTILKLIGQEFGVGLRGPAPSVAAKPATVQQHRS